MTFAPDTAAALRVLRARTTALLDVLLAARTASGRPVPRALEAVDIVRRYEAALIAGMSRGDAGEALRGANGLSGVNKGLGDWVIPELPDDVGDLTVALLHAAIDAGQLLRRERHGAS